MRGIHRSSTRATRRRTALTCIGALCLSSAMILPAWAADDVAEMSLEDLMNVEVTSVSKKAQHKTDAAAAITVITSDELRRGGFTSVPEALRVVPGVQVARIDANRWAISARGFNQEFANKLLVMIDGRSVYTPLFGGVYWDIQDYPIQDIERIEVIRGPGGTIWGANAVNGVINVITKHSKNTQGALLSGYAGSQEYGGTGRWGGKVGKDTSYRVFGRGFKYADQDIDQHHDAKDEWNQGRAGFRVDHDPTENDQLMLSADYYNTSEDRGLFTGASFDRRTFGAEGGDVLLKWNRKLENAGNFSTKAYYDRTDRDSTIEEERHTAEVEFQHDFTLNQGESVETHITWGANYRFSTSHINGIPTQSFIPNDEDFHLGGGFVQSQFDFFDRKLSLIAGIKLGGNNWSDFEYQPSGRIVVKPWQGHTFWAAVSRAVRTPTQLDRDLFATIPVPPAAVTLVGNDDQRSEELLSFEGGYRFFQWEKVTAEVSIFHNRYDSVTSLRAIGLGTFSFGNAGDVETTGGELEINVMPWDWWRLSLGYAVLEIDADGPSSPLDGTNTSKSYPQNQLTLRSFFDLPMDFELDVTVYYVDGLKGVVPARIPPTNENVEQYVRLDLRLGYRPTDWLELALVGQNLTDRRHQEFSDVQNNLSSQVPRSGYGMATFRF
jgi:iron complex outermembrane receptor protein